MDELYQLYCRTWWIKKELSVSFFFYPDLHCGFSRLPRAFLSLREEDTGDGKRALGKFHVLERNQGLFPVHVSLSTLQASGMFFFLEWWWKRRLGSSAEKPPHSFASDSFPKEAATVPEWEGGGAMGEVICTLNCLCSMSHMAAALLGTMPALVCSVRVELHSVK